MHDFKSSTPYYVSLAPSPRPPFSHIAYCFFYHNSLISQFPSFNAFNVNLPSSVKSGLPLISPFKLSVKNRGCHSSSFSSLCLALTLCASSNSCFSVVARLNWRELIASVTPAQNRRDSFGSWEDVGGTILGITERGVRSRRRICRSCGCG